MTVRRKQTTEAGSPAQYEAAVDKAIAAAGGDLRGALEALLRANEFLEHALFAAHEATHTYQAPRAGHANTARPERADARGRRIAA